MVFDAGVDIIGGEIYLVVFICVWGNFHLALEVRKKTSGLTKYVRRSYRMLHLWQV